MKMLRPLALAICTLCIGWCAPPSIARITAGDALAPASGGEARSERMTATARRALSAPAIDGRLDEPAWNATSTVTRDAIGTHNNAVRFGALWDETGLYVGVEVV